MDVLRGAYTSGYSINVLQVCQSHKRKDNLLSDICDGELFESHELYQKFPGALQLITYFDEVEPCNVLGAQAGIHKLGKFLKVICILHPIFVYYVHTSNVLLHSWKY